MARVCPKGGLAESMPQATHVGMTQSSDMNFDLTYLFPINPSRLVISVLSEHQTEYVG
jgi:hypothetical protein